MDISFLKALASSLGADSLEEDGKALRMHFRKDAPLDPQKLMEITNSLGRGARLIPREETVRLVVPFPKGAKEKDTMRLLRIRKLLERLAEARIEDGELDERTS